MGNELRVDLGVESTVSEKGQITIPKQVRELLNLTYKDTVKFYQTEDGVVLRNGSELQEVNLFKYVARLLKHEKVVSVNGDLKSGKSVLTGKLLSYIGKGKHIGFITETTKAYNTLQENLDETDIGSLKLLPVTMLGNEVVQKTGLETYIQECDILVVDELAFKLNREWVEGLGLVELVRNFKGTLIVESTSTVEELVVGKDHVELKVKTKIFSDADYNTSVEVFLHDYVDGRRNTIQA